MSTNPCPLCGGKVAKDEMFCRSCQQIAKKSSLENRLKPSPLISTHPQKLKEVKPMPQMAEKESHLLNNSLQAESSKSKKKYLILKITALITILVIGGSLVSFFTSREHQEEKEYWLQCIDQNTSLSYAEYLKTYPKGTYSSDAEDKIRELKNEELVSWNQLKSTNNIDAFIYFLEEYPNTPYLYEIRSKIDALAWQKALQENSADAYLAYLENVKVGNYAGNFKDIASSNYDYLSQMVVLEGKEYKQMLDRTALIIEALSKNKSTKLADYLSDSLVSMFDIKGLNKKAMIDSVGNIYKRQANGDKSRLKLIDGQTSILKDVNSTYFVHTSVVRSMMDKTKNDTLNLIVKLNADKKMESMDKAK